MDIKAYKTWCFDCDGVLLDSNQLKSCAFYESALPYGEEKAQSLVAYNKHHGGVTRFDKFKYFFEKIIGQEDYEKDLKDILEQYSALVREKLLNCPETTWLREFLDMLMPDTKKIVVSGGLQSEIREVFRLKGLDKYFDGIYGSPESKEAIVAKRVIGNGMSYPVVYVGDSRYDYEVAAQFKFDFIFMSKYSEFSDWRLFFEGKEIEIIESFDVLCHCK